MVLPSYSPLMRFVSCGSGGDEEPSGEEVLRLIQIRLTKLSLEKTLPCCQDIIAARIVVSGSRNAVSNVVGTHKPNAVLHHDALLAPQIKTKESLDFFAIRLSIGCKN
jgi:hypothetical protein